MIPNAYVKGHRRHWWQCRISANVVWRCAAAQALIAAGVERARALAVSFADAEAALKIVATARSIRADLPIVVRTTDEEPIEGCSPPAQLVVPEVLEGSLMLASHSLLLLGTPLSKVLLRRIRAVREERYSLFQGFYRGASDGNENGTTPACCTPCIWVMAPTRWSRTWGEVAAAFTRWRRRSYPGTSRRGAAAASCRQFVFENGDAIVLLGAARRVVAGAASNRLTDTYRQTAPTRNCEAVKSRGTFAESGRSE